MSTNNICFYGEIAEAILMSTHNIRFYGEIKIIPPYLFRCHNNSVYWNKQVGEYSVLRYAEAAF